ARGAAGTMVSLTRVRSPRDRRRLLRSARAEDSACAHAGCAGPQPRNPGRGRGPQSAAADARSQRSAGFGLATRPGAEEWRRHRRRRGSGAGGIVMRAAHVPSRKAVRIERRKRKKFVILTGLSGAGKSQAIRALEDLGYFCIDNLPTMLIPTMAELSTREDAGLDKVAIVVDVREGGFLSQFPGVFRRLRTTPGIDPTLIFLEASHQVLVRRFSETRRPHPLAPDRS